MVAALAWVGETLVVPEGTRITMMTREAFDNMLLKEVSHNYDNYDNYRLLSQQVLGLGVEAMPEGVEIVHHKCLKSRLD